MSATLPALIMTPPAGSTPAEQWLARGQTAAACDLVTALQASRCVDPIYACCARVEDREILRSLGARTWESAEEPFHFGRVLAAFVADRRIERLAYFGGASAPLLPPETVREAVDWLGESSGPAAAVNNYHSTDWAVFNHAAALGPLSGEFPTDNPLGWVLDHQGGFAIHAFAPSADTRADIDTPSDLLLLDGHAHLGRAVRTFLGEAPGVARARVSAIRKVLNTPASTVTLIGRSSSHLWSLLERRGQVWVRLLVEERGMVASGRAARGEVRTLVGEMLETWGARVFVERLAGMCEAALWDTRVWMASRGAWPSAADRFAADLGWWEAVSDPGLAELTHALAEAPIPVIAGGHGVVAGSVYALVETLEPV